MFKRIVSGLLVLAFLCLVPVLAGCEQDEIKTQRHVEVKDRVVEQKTVVE